MWIVKLTAPAGIESDKPNAYINAPVMARSLLRLSTAKDEVLIWSATMGIFTVNDIFVLKAKLGSTDGTAVGPDVG